ncbi:hypothetical protein DEU38_105251 [Rhodococcus sp. AG1013]|nr:hypothetical protein DEU38_105251 [Rhodococcus sp. AG1013]
MLERLSEPLWGGEREGEHAWISAAAVTLLAGADGVGEGWRVGLEAMSEYTCGHGWLRADGAIRAHIGYR